MHYDYVEEENTKTCQFRVSTKESILFQIQSADDSERREKRKATQGRHRDPPPRMAEGGSQRPD